MQLAHRARGYADAVLDDAHGIGAEGIGQAADRFVGLGPGQRIDEEEESAPGCPCMHGETVGRRGTV